MRIVYIHGTSAPADQLDEHTAAVADAIVVRDASADRTRYDALLALLDEGDELLTPGLEHLGDTARTALAALRRAVDAGIRVTLLRDGLEGGVVLQAAALLEALPDAGEAPPPRRPGGRPYGRVTPERVAQILALSAAGVVVREIAVTVGLSVGAVMKVRRTHRAVPRAPWTADGLAECLGSAD